VTSSPHDALFKAAFSSPEHAAPQLRAVLPPAVSALLDWASLTLEPGSFLDGELAAFHSDLLFSASLAGHPSLLYLLFEHQSSTDAWMPFRVLRYQVRIWEAYLKDHPGEIHLPPVIVVVLPHAPGGWTAATTMHELFEPALVAEPALAALLPQFRMVLDDLSQVDDDALQARALGAFPRLALWALRDARTPERLVATMKGWVSAMGELLAAPNGAEALRTLLRYLYLVADKTTFERVSETMRQLPPVQATGQTIAEWLHERGRDEGLKVGRDEGLKAGALREGRKALRRVLAWKKLALTAEQEALIEACTDLALLERWQEQALPAATVADALR
jgi:hypothetical protein